MEKIRRKNTWSKWWWLTALLLLIVINYAGSVFHQRFDLTSENRFTLSSPTKKLLKGLKGKVSIEVFLGGELPSGFKKLARSTEDILREFKELAGENLEYEFVSADEEMPGTGKSYADTLTGLGAFPINLTSQVEKGQQSQYVFPSALVHYGEKLMVVNLFSGNTVVITPAELNSAEAQMEYNFAFAIEKLMRDTKPLIGYTIGNGQPDDGSTYDLRANILQPDYDLKVLDLTKFPVIPDTFKLLLIVKPSIPFTEAQKMRLDQYVMRGGKIIWFIDRLEAETDSLSIKGQVIAYDRNLNLEDLLFRYGVRINPDLLMDLQSDFLPMGINGQGQTEFLHWNYFPLFESSNNHPTNKNLGLISGRFVNTIDTVNAEEVKKTVLLSSSANSRSISAPAMITADENRNAPEDAAFKQKNLIAGVLLEGNFKSLYANRMPAAMLDSFVAYGQPFQSASLAPNKMIVISDGDLALNRASQGEPLPMGVNPYTIGSQYEYRFKNREFIQNSIEYLANSSGLTEARSKDYVLRVLDKKKVDDQRLKWQILNILIPILIVILFGITYQWWRKRRYA